MNPKLLNHVPNTTTNRPFTSNARTRKDSDIQREAHKQFNRYRSRLPARIRVQLELPSIATWEKHTSAKD